MLIAPSLVVPDCALGCPVPVVPAPVPVPAAAPEEPVAGVLVTGTQRTVVVEVAAADVPAAPELVPVPAVPLAVVEPVPAPAVPDAPELPVLPGVPLVPLGRSNVVSRTVPGGQV